MLYPADHEEWDEVVCDAYPLNKYVIENNDIAIKLYSSGKKPTFFANAPYLEEGGVLYKNNSLNWNLNNSISDLFTEYNLKYVLVKSRDRSTSEIVPEQYIDNKYYTFLLDTTIDIESVWNEKLKAKTRNQIRKGEKNNFEIKFGHIELLDKFYSVISRCWRDLGTPVHSYQFFKLILERFGDRVSIIVLFDKGIPISSALLFKINGVLSHPFAGTINKYKPSSANNVLYWNIIKHACENEINIFDMGRSRLNQGTYHFKKSWGGEVQNIYYYYFMNVNGNIPAYDSSFYKIATNMWKFMPLQLANKIGPRLIYKIL